jgi:hypothetical protein
MVVKQASAQVLRFPLQKSAAEQVLEELWEYSRTDPLQDLLVIAKFDDSDPKLGMAGRYWDNPDEAVAAVRYAEWKIRWHRSLREG